MTIDTKRLETDAAYWRECGAPDWATHYCPVSKLFYDDNYPIAPCCIPRPTTPAAPEWDGDGLPPVGEDVEASFVSGSMDQYWSKGKVVAHDNGLPVVRVGGVYYGLNLERLRPLRTKEQRQKDELADLIENHQMENGSFCTPENTAEAILSSYNLEPKL